MFKGEICIFLCLVRPSELLHHIAAPHAGCQSGGHLNAEKSRLSQTHPIPVESSSHVKGVFSCCLCAENDALGNMLLPMKSSFFLKHNILSHIMVLQKKKAFLLFTGQLNARFCWFLKRDWASCYHEEHPAQARHPDTSDRKEYDGLKWVRRDRRKTCFSGPRGLLT